MSEPCLIVICGPTGVRKTSIAVETARVLKTEIISADSRQIYRMLDIGSGKPTAEERKDVIHHGLDIVDPSEKYSVAKFARYARTLIEKIQKKNKIPILEGGSGLYIRGTLQGLTDAPACDPELRSSLKEKEKREGPGTLYRRLQDVDPEAATRIKPADQIRVIRALEVYEKTGVTLSQRLRDDPGQKLNCKQFIYGVFLPRKALYEAVNRRVEDMFARGFIDEVKRLKEKGYGNAVRTLHGLGYAAAMDYIDGKINLEETRDIMKRETRRYAKRQITWFKKTEGLIWLEGGSPEKEKTAVRKILSDVKDCLGCPDDVLKLYDMD